MSNTTTHYTDEDIHAYVDGQLDESLQQAITLRMKTDQALAQKVAGYRLINANLQLSLNPIEYEPIPERLLIASTLCSQPITTLSGNTVKRIAQVTMIVVLMVTSGIAGWFLKGNDQQHNRVQLHTDLIQPAIFAHSVYATDNMHPVEIDANHEEQLMTWLSKRMKTNIKAPNLAAQGYQLLGGRLIPSTNRMAAQFMYQNAEGIRVSLYIRRGNWDNNNIPMHYNEGDGLAAFTWVDNSMGYALSGQLQKGELLALAETAHRFE